MPASQAQEMHEEGRLRAAPREIMLLPYVLAAACRRGERRAGRGAAISTGGLGGNGRASPPRQPCAPPVPAAAVGFHWRRRPAPADAGRRGLECVSASVAGRPSGCTFRWVLPPQRAVSGWDDTQACSSAPSRTHTRTGAPTPTHCVACTQPQPPDSAGTLTDVVYPLRSVDSAVRPFVLEAAYVTAAGAARRGGGRWARQLRRRAAPLMLIST